jgi:hypothetical protein
MKQKEKKGRERERHAFIRESRLFPRGVSRALNLTKFDPRSRTSSSQRDLPRIPDYAGEEERGKRREDNLVLFLAAVCATYLYEFPQFGNGGRNFSGLQQQQQHIIRADVLTVISMRQPGVSRLQ